MNLLENLLKMMVAEIKVLMLTLWLFQVTEWGQILQSSEFARGRYTDELLWLLYRVRHHIIIFQRLKRHYIYIGSTQNNKNTTNKVNNVLALYQVCLKGTQNLNL